MIKTSELRLGNLFMAPGNLLAHVIEIKPGYAICKAGNLTFLLASVEPIRITPEWLAKLGFKMGAKSSRIGEGRYWSIGDFQIVGTTEGMILPVSYRLMGSEWATGEDLRYTYQLQNLYFALTGEELQTQQP